MPDREWETWLINNAAARGKKLPDELRLARLRRHEDYGLAYVLWKVGDPASAEMILRRVFEELEDGE